MTDHESEWGFETLYEENADRIYRYCYRLCGNRTDAEDLAQSTFVAAWAGWKEFAGRGPVAAWLYTIAYRQWVRSRRGMLETVPMLDDVDSVDPVRSADAGHVERIWLDEAIAGLSEPLREALVLVKVEGLTHQQAAGLLDLPLGTVLWRVNAAVKQLRRKLLESGGLAAVLPALRLGSALDQWRDVRPSAAFRARVREALHKAGAPVKPEAPSPEGNTGASAQPPAEGKKEPNRSLVRLRWPAGIAGLLLGAGGVWYWFQKPQGPPAPPTLNSTLDAMARVRTAHAKGTLEIDPEGRTDRAGVDCWFRSPASYWIMVTPPATSALFKQTIAVNGNRAEIVRWLSDGGIRRESLRGRDAEAGLTAFSFFTREAPFSRAARSSPEVTPLRAELGSREVVMFSVERRAGPEAIRWELDVDPTTARVVGATTETLVWRGRKQVLGKRVILTDFEYDRDLPETVTRQ